MFFIVDIIFNDFCDVVEVTGERNMKEVYDSYCIPVFGAISSPMGRRNDFSCDFLNVSDVAMSWFTIV